VRKLNLLSEFPKLRFLQSHLLTITHQQNRHQYPLPHPENYPMNNHHTMELSTMNLSAIRELSLEKCRLNHESIDDLARMNLPSLNRLILSKSISMEMIMRSVR